MHDGAEVKADEGNEEGKTLQDQLEFQVSLQDNLAKGALKHKTKTN